MTSSALVWAWQQHVTPTSKLVLLALAEQASGDHHAIQLETAVANLQHRTGLNRRTVQRHLRDLEASSHIVVEQRRDTHGSRLPNRWYLNANVLTPVPLDLYASQARPS